MEAIGGESVDMKKVKEVFDIFEPDDDGQEIKKLQIINGKLCIKYKEGE